MDCHDLNSVWCNYLVDPSLVYVPGCPTTKEHAQGGEHRGRDPLVHGLKLSDEMANPPKVVQDVRWPRVRAIRCTENPQHFLKEVLWVDPSCESTALVF